MSDNPKPNLPTPTPDEIRIKQFENELASKERLTAAAKTEIERVWKEHERITNLVKRLSIVGAVMLAFFGLTTCSDIKQTAKKAAESEVDKVRQEVRDELNRQFAKEEIQKIITDKAKERIDLTAGPLVEELVRNNLSSWISGTVKNIYGNMTNETFSVTDTRHVITIPNTNGSMLCIVRLSNVPITGSLETMTMAPPLNVPQVSYGSPPGYKNLLQMTMWGYDTNTLRFTFRYVIDTRETNYYSAEMPVLNRDIQINSDGNVTYRLLDNVTK